MGRVITYITPPRLARFPELDDPLEYSTRSWVVGRDGRGVLRSWGSPEDPWPIRIEPDGGRWRVEAPGRAPSVVRAAARTIFSLEHPLEEFYRLTRREEVLGGTERTFRGLRTPRDASLYESLLSAIIGQQLSVAVAATLARRLTEATGSFVAFDGFELATAPTPWALRSLGVRGLRKLGLSRAKTASLLGIARGQSLHRFDRETYARLDAEAAIERLDVERGVGRWTAENALLRGAGRTDVFVAGDLGLRVALAEYGGIPREAPEAVARAWAEARYPGWGSYATLYLWKKLATRCG